MLSALLAGSIHGQVSISPAAPAVASGQSIAITASGCGSGCSITLTGVGSITTSGTTVTYTAPASVPPQHKMLGCEVMPNDSVFNTRIDSLPVNSNSATWISNSSTVGFQFQPSWGISYADSATPTRTLKSYYGNYVNVFPWPTGNAMKREGGNYIGGTGFSAPDHHVMTVRRTDCTFWDSYGDRLNGVTVTCQDGVTLGCNDSSQITYPWSNYQFQAAGGTDAAGLPLAPLTLSLEELLAGSIKHALRFTTALGYIQGSGNLGYPLLWPAANSNGCPTSTCPNAPIIGARLRLKSTFSVSSFSALAQVLLTAMQQYGLILADIGTSNAITTSSDITTDAAAVSAIEQIQTAAIGPSNFEFVDESSLEVSATSYQVCPLNQTCLGAQNTFEAPLDSAVLTFTPSSGTPLSVPIALQGVSIGTRVGPDVSVLAGSYTWQIPTWVNGSANQTVTWALTSGVGSITTGGVYSPPSTLSGGSTAVLTGTAAADAAATIKLYLTILPPGTIRIDTGATANTTDLVGNAWTGALQPEGWAVLYNDNYPGWTTTSAQRIQYQSGVYSYANDLLQDSIIVPNGNYDVFVLLGLNGQCGTAPCGTFPKPGIASQFSYEPVHLESQQQIGAYTYDWLLPTGYISAAPSPLIAIPAKVTNNQLYAAVRGIANDAAPLYAPGGILTKATLLSGLMIAPDTSSPHWSVWTQQQSTIAAGQTLLPFRVVDWYTGVNDPTWSINGPPGITINSSTGVVTATNVARLAGQPVTVTASDGTYSAAATIYTVGSAYAINPIPHFNRYAYRRQLTIDHTQVGASDLANFPIPVQITDPTLASVPNGGHVQSNSGYDIIITSDAGCTTMLTWEVTKYNPVTGTWLGWFKQPDVSHTANSQAYLCYGNPTPYGPQSATPAATWNANYTGVYHFENFLADSTSNAYTLTSTNTIYITQATNGYIGAAAAIGSIWTLQAPPGVLAGGNKGTISMWADVTGAAANVPEDMGYESDSNGIIHFFELTNPMSLGWVFGGGATDDRWSTSTAPATGAWHLFTYTWDQTVPAQFAYLDGAQIGTNTTAFTITTPTGVYQIGGLTNYNMLGNIDEVRFSSIALPAAWIAAEYASQKQASTFLSIGSEIIN